MICAAKNELLDKLVELNRPITLKCCRRLGLSDHQAEDIASETFLAAYRNLDKFNKQSKFTTWLWSIAKNQAITHLRKEKRQQKLLSQLIPNEQNTDQSPYSNIAKDAQAELIWSKVKKLPHRLASSTELFYRYNKKTDQIAGILSIPSASVRSSLYRARNILKKQLSSCC